MKVLMVASECFPLVKTGGLADVVGALPHALANLDCDARVLLPLYQPVAAALEKQRRVADLGDLFGGPASVVAGETAHGLEIFALQAPHLFDRPGNPYLGPDGRDWRDNHLRFGALCRAAAAIATAPPDGFVPDVVHAHDWQAGLVPIYLAAAAARPPPVAFTIHNIAFGGLFPASAGPQLGLPASGFTPTGYEFYGQVSFLKAGLVGATRVSTVSPTYAVELQTPAFGMGFDGVLRARSGDLVGILNGIDDEVWDPQTDPHIPARYGLRTLARKAASREAAQRTLGLDIDPGALLFCVVSRLTDQKGLDLLAANLPRLLAGGGQLALLGSGAPALEARFSAAARAHPGRVGVRLGYDEPLSHLLIAGADAILVPSRFEPCGLTQLYGLRYGTVPIVARTGGLADSVIDANDAARGASVATGIVFDPIDEAGLARALARAFALFAEPAAWKELVRNGLRQPVGWPRSAASYRELYAGLVGTS